MTAAKTPSTPYVILAAIDATSIADLVLDQAASLARRIPGAELHVLHVPERFTHAPITDRTFDLDVGRRFVEAAAVKARAASDVRVVVHLLEREPAAAILQLAASLDADLIVVGTHDRRGPERWFLGSTTQKVAQRAACAVLVARPKDHVASSAPEIDPPCPDCVRTQRESHGASMWCARHSERHPHAHLHYELPEGFGAGSSLIGG